MTTEVNATWTRTVVDNAGEQSSPLAGRAYNDDRVAAIMSRRPHCVGGDLPVSDIMTPVTFALQADASIARAAALMVCEGVHRLPIVGESGEVVGIVTSFDIARWVARRGGFVV